MWSRDVSVRCRLVSPEQHFSRGEGIDSVCLAVCLDLEQPDTLTRRRGLRGHNAAGSRARESMREFSRASRGAGASGVVHVQVLGRACVFALSLRWRQPVYG